MATAIEAQIPDALMTRLGTLPVSPALSVAYPGREFTPPDGEYLEAAFLPNRNVSLFLKGANSTQYQGLFQVTVVWSLDDSGIIPAQEVAGQIVDHFDKGTLLSATGFYVRIPERPSIGPPIQERHRLRVPVTIPYIRITSPATERGFSLSKGNP